MGSEASPQPVVLGRYSLYDEIASGGMASVHLGRLLGPAGFARTVAIKRMHPHCAKEREFVAMFVDEARLAARVQHPNVVPTLDVVATQDELFLVMEYVRGESLARLQREASKRGERLAPRVACAIVNGVLQGLHAAHEAKSERGEDLHMVHRDVSAPNVLVGADGVARVLDFGIAKAAGRIGTTREGQVKGKLAYMSPEQIRGAKVNRTTDVYAAGVLLWEALTGTRLFAAETDSETLNRVLSLRVRAPREVVADLPRALDAVVLRALERDPELRFATAREMALALQAAVDPAPSSEVGELVERLASEALTKRGMLVADVERRSAKTLPAAPVEVDAAAARPSAARRPRRGSAIAMPVLAAALLATTVTVFAVRSRSGEAAGAVAAPASSSASSSSVSVSVSPSAPPPGGDSAAVSDPSPLPAPATTVAATLAPGASARVAHPHRVSPPSRPSCEPPWYLDATGIKKWKPECR